MEARLTEQQLLLIGCVQSAGLQAGVAPVSIMY